jgi:hypothetical protein
MLDDVSGSRRQPDAARLAPDGPIDLVFIADLQRARCLFDDEDRIAHLSTGTPILDGNLFPEADTSKSQFWKLFLNLPAQAILLGLATPLATAWKHPEPIALPPNQQDFSALYRNELRRLSHLSRKAESVRTGQRLYEVV